ncbi:amino acid ABC transporter permease [Pseudomonas silvicola]|nr:amino acid ABC transporter permease [Pseudomonas silvicola]
MWDNIMVFLPLLLKGAVVTLQVTALAVLLSTLLGLLWALLQLSRWPAVRSATRWAVNVLRSLPIVILLFYFYFVMPDLGINLSAFTAGVIGLGLAYSAYQAENFRSGIEAVDRGQREAAQSIGMKEGLILRRVVLPQAFKIALPPYGNTFTMILKDSSLVSTITVAEMTHAGQLIASSTYQNMTVYTLVALLYVAMGLPLLYGVGRLEKRFAHR